MLKGRLFDGAAKDRDVEVTRGLVEDLDERQILWIDLPSAGDDEIAELGRVLELKPASVHALRRPTGRPRMDLFGDYSQIFVNAVELQEHGIKPAGLGIIVTETVVATVHREPVEFLDSFQDSLKGDTAIGLVDAESFLAALLDWHLNGYFRAIEALEDEADRLDHRALHPRSESDLLGDLVRVRRRISHVRRELAPHRELFAALTRPDLTGLSQSEVAPHFRALADRLDRAIDAVEVARELVLGSFDVYMTRTAQRTNEVMKVLTLASVILLPGSMIAGIMGMNFKVGLFDDPNYFWVVVAAIAAIAAVTLGVARFKRWI